MSEREMKIEIACRLFDADKLHKPQAARLAGLSRAEFEDELLKRGLALFHIDEEYVRHDLEMAAKFDADRGDE
jgi:predicted HTH domain antitoxin